MKTKKLLTLSLCLALCMVLVTTSSQAQKFWWQKENGETKNVKSPKAITTPFNPNKNKDEEETENPFKRNQIWNRLAHQNSKSKSYIMKLPSNTDQEIAIQIKNMQNIEKVNAKNIEKIRRVAKLREIKLQRRLKMLRSQSTNTASQQQATQQQNRVYRILDTDKIPTKPRVFRTLDQ